METQTMQNETVTQPQTQPPYTPPNGAPARQLNTKRSLLKYILLSIVTLGIYSLVFWSGISSDINLIASRYDGKKTMHYCLLAFLVGGITFGIGFLVWYHRISARMGVEMVRRHIDFKFGASDFWIFNILLSFTVVCPLIYVHKIAKASSLLAQHYNVNG